MRIAAVGSAFPPHYYDQTALLGALSDLWARTHHNPGRLERLHHNVGVGGRHLALPIDDYESLRSFGEANDAWLRVAPAVGADALRAALDGAGLGPADIDCFISTTVTGVATPSIEALLMNRLGIQTAAKRVPLFGLGCMAGAAGLARAADYLRAYPQEVAVLLSVELCSLTLQREDLSIPNLIASGLFGDGGAAVVMLGADHPAAPTLPADGGPTVVASRSVFYPDTEDVLGWSISSGGFGIVLSSDLTRMVRDNVRADLEAFLAEHDLTLADIGSWVCHPGGPKVLDAVADALELPDDALALSWQSLRERGNVSSTSVLLVLDTTMRTARPAPGTFGILMAMGPGFSLELVLLRW